MPDASVFAVFDDAVDGLIAVIAGVEDGQWDQPGLGVWTVRSLVGHAGRAATTLANYLAADEPSELTFERAETYYASFLKAKVSSAADEDVAERGIQAGIDLGDAPVAAVREWADEALGRLSSASPERLVATRFGAMRLEEYLRTRIFELTVHGLDLARATGQPLELVPGSAVALCLELAAGVAAETGRGADLLLALTGRASLPHGFAVV